MARKSRNKKKNEKYLELISVTYLKRDGDVGLFKTPDGCKIRVHKEHIFGTLGWITKGSLVGVRMAYAVPVDKKRKIVTNLDDLSIAVVDPAAEDTVDAKDILVVDCKFEATRMGLPIGTQYSWFCLKTKLERGMYVMMYNTGSYKGLKGYISNLDEKKKVCFIDGSRYLTSQIGYVIVNPLFIHNQRLIEA